MSTPLSGKPFALRSGSFEARIASVGASLRSLRWNGVDLIVPFGEDEIRPSMRGAFLAPWPNRIAGGRFEFAGAVHQLVQNEPDTRTAAHGLIAWIDFAATAVAPDNLVLTAVIAPQPGYPWRVRVDAEFRLSTAGLSQEITATNESATSAPVGLGGHPYLVAESPRARGIDELALELDAERILLISEDRMLPMREVHVADPLADGRDFRESRRIGRTEINHAFTGLDRRDGLARARLLADDGTGVEIEWDERCPWVQVYTTDHGAGEEFRSGVAIEPMTCPPDAFNSRRDLLVVPPGGSVSAGWVIRPVPA
ncbi:aldose 1-epimerase family protein [Microbacterium sp. SA39]|uniref:aldose 1-epimerase family protein n=1 Tax=Microbacterium sp. SA39 TaxID=1263625 RepID=UPI0005F9E3CC|nr:aldose 1-epimerase family protein [Microbacterium sp. SA39]KJQ55726.1 Aldose 1-epimerase [Microbacterium sp. SA39]